MKTKKKQVDLCFCCEGTRTKHLPDCPMLTLPKDAPTSAGENQQ